MQGADSHGCPHLAWNEHMHTVKQSDNRGWFASLSQPCKPSAHMGTLLGGLWTTGCGFPFIVYVQRTSCAMRLPTALVSERPLSCKFSQLDLWV